jgi:hypothetical protein
LNQIYSELKGQTDLPVEIIGIHDLGQTLNSRMYSGKPTVWLRENSTFRPWSTWSVPIPARAGSAFRVEWRDLVILNEKNEFLAVQNLTDESLTVAANKTALKNFLRNAAAAIDTDADGLPDKWEQRHAQVTNPASLDSVAAAPLGITPGGIKNLMAYAFAEDPASSAQTMMPVPRMTRIGGSNYLELRFRRLLGQQGAQALTYTPQLSEDGITWTDAGWAPSTVSNPWDGTGTEIVTIRTTAPVGSIRSRMTRVKVEVNP